MRLRSSEGVEVGAVVSVYDFYGLDFFGPVWGNLGGGYVVI